MLHILEQGQLADLHLLRQARPNANLQDYQYCQLEAFPWAWERDLGLDASEDLLQKWIPGLLFSSRCCKIQELNYKILLRCNICWRCDVGTLLHIFWDCPVLTTYWPVLARDLSVSPAPTLLFWAAENTEGVPDYTLERHLLNEAKLLIPRLWKSWAPPTPKAWIEKVNELAKFEELSTFTGKQHSWLRWFLYRNSSEYSQFLSS
ncbi:hypothetical protein XELAEV_18037340mg [Xenopus laevis]|uniref:Uncharacterized protein n=1 Tax=Xenopus laevis TaxID=8355 RepID=A0A974CCE6_XENLA|nr:hypothetical protein XELAEV_18037340mg [Xenopus laevis]